MAIPILGPAFYESPSMEGVIPSKTVELFMQEGDKLQKRIERISLETDAQIKAPVVTGLYADAYGRIAGGDFSAFSDLGKARQLAIGNPLLMGVVDQAEKIGGVLANTWLEGQRKNDEAAMEEERFQHRLAIEQMREQARTEQQNRTINRQIEASGEVTNRQLYAQERSSYNERHRQWEADRQRIEMRNNRVQEGAKRFKEETGQDQPVELWPIPPEPIAPKPEDFNLRPLETRGTTGIQESGAGEEPLPLFGDNVRPNPMDQGAAPAPTKPAPVELTPAPTESGTPPTPKGVEPDQTIRFGYDVFEFRDPGLKKKGMDYNPETGLTYHYVQNEDYDKIRQVANRFATKSNFSEWASRMSRLGFDVEFEAGDVSKGKANVWYAKAGDVYFQRPPDDQEKIAQANSKADGNKPHYIKVGFTEGDKEAWDRFQELKGSMSGSFRQKKVDLSKDANFVQSVDRATTAMWERRHEIPLKPEEIERVRAQREAVKLPQLDFSDQVVEKPKISQEEMQLRNKGIISPEEQSRRNSEAKAIQDASVMAQELARQVEAIDAKIMKVKMPPHDLTKEEFESVKQLQSERNVLTKQMREARSKAMSASRFQMPASFQ